MNSENKSITSSKYLEKMTVDLTIVNPAKLSFKNKCGKDIFKKIRFIHKECLFYERNAKQRCWLTLNFFSEWK